MSAPTIELRQVAPSTRDIALLDALPQLTRTAATSIPATLRAAGQARHFVADALQAWGLAALSETTVLIASELVTNALVHGLAGEALADGQEVTVRVIDVPGGVRLEVDDHNPAALPAACAAAGDDEHHRGLLLLEHLAAAHGEVLRPGGKTVWAQVRAA